MDQNRGQEMSVIKDNTDIEKKDISKKVLGLFENAEYLRLALLKTDRLASALYLVSNLMSDTEPLKRTLRQQGVELVTDIGSVETSAREIGQSVAVGKIRSKILATISLLEVSFMGGLISKMNYEILKSEFFKLKDFLEKRFLSSTENSLIMTGDFFYPEEMLTIENKAKTVSEKIVSQEKIYSTSSPEASQANEQGGVRPFVKDIRYIGQVKDIVGKMAHDLNRNINTSVIGNISANLKNGEVLSDSKLKRHGLILSALKSGASHTVPEILTLTGLGTELSEKTIQRDLLLLVSKGQLKKTGERRWSKYSIM